MDYISEKFIRSRNRNIPVIIKLSTDTNVSLIPKLIDVLCDAKFDGVNFGNTSINYDDFRQFCNDKDIKNFNYFSEVFGGGLSGRFLKKKSYDLCKAASEYLSSKSYGEEFNIIRKF